MNISRRGFLGGILAAGASAAIIRTPGLIMPINPWLGFDMPRTIAFSNYFGELGGVIEFDDGSRFRFVPKRLPPGMSGQSIWAMRGNIAAARSLIYPVDFEAMARMRWSVRDKDVAWGSKSPITWDRIDDPLGAGGEHGFGNRRDGKACAVMLPLESHLQEYEDEIVTA